MFVSESSTEDTRCVCGIALTKMFVFLCWPSQCSFRSKFLASCGLGLYMMRKGLKKTSHWQKVKNENLLKANGEDFSTHFENDCFKSTHGSLLIFQRVQKIAPMLLCRETFIVWLLQHWKFISCQEISKNFRHLKHSTALVFSSFFWICQKCFLYGFWVRAWPALRCCKLHANRECSCLEQRKVQKKNSQPICASENGIKSFELELRMVKRLQLVIKPASTFIVGVFLWHFCWGPIQANSSVHHNSHLEFRCFQQTFSVIYTWQ